jgi:streptogramin lyase
MMKRRPLIAVAVTAAIVAAPLSTAGCSTSSRTTLTTKSPSVPVMSSQLWSAAAPTSTDPSRPVTYSSQVVLPFGDNINHLSGLAVDTADNVYVLDHYYGQVWKQAPGASRLTTLAFTDIGQPVDVTVDNGGNLYVTDVLENRVLKLAPGVSSPTVLPFTDLNQIAGVAVDTADTVYVADFGANRVLKLAPDASSPTVLPFTDLNKPSTVAVDTAGDVYVLDEGNFRVLKLPAR